MQLELAIAAVRFDVVALAIKSFAFQFSALGCFGSRVRFGLVIERSKALGLTASSFRTYKRRRCLDFQGCRPLAL